MKPFDIHTLLRQNIQQMHPYASARSEYSGTATVFLDANENSMGSTAGAGYNRYPDPLQTQLKACIAQLKNVSPQNIFIGNGSDEPIDLLIRALCTPGADEVLVCAPTYGMYDVAAAVNDVRATTVCMTDSFQLDVEAILKAVTPRTKIIFICSPNNPTGNLIHKQDIETLLKQFNGVVVIDEAYIDFAPGATWLPQLNSYPNIVVLQTLSKAWGLAALRVGFAFASPAIIQVLNKIKYPYNVNALSQQMALEALDKKDVVQQWVADIIQQRTLLSQSLTQFDFVEQVYPSDANFILVRVRDARSLYTYLLQQGIVVRLRHTMPLCAGCIRITVGTARENELLITALKQYSL